MTLKRDRENIQAKLTATQGLLATVKDHALMSYSLRIREEMLMEELDSMPVNEKESKVVLFFFG